MIFRIYNDSLLSSEKPHPWADRRGNQWTVDIDDPSDLLTLAGSTGKITIYCRRDDPTIEIADEDE